MNNRQTILERLVTLGNGIEEKLTLLQGLLEQKGNSDSELRLVREVHQDYMFRRALLRKLQERFQKVAAPELVDKLFDSLEE
jgi:hypothetical protein